MFGRVFFTQPLPTSLENALNENGAAIAALAFVELPHVFVGFVPDLKGCMSDGATAVEALQNTEQAIREWIDAAKEFGQDVPAPNSSHENSIRSRKGLMKKVQEQTKAIEGLEKEVKRLRKMLSSISNRVADSGSSWLLESMPAVIAQKNKEPVVH